MDGRYTPFYPDRFDFFFNIHTVLVFGDRVGIYSVRFRAANMVSPIIVQAMGGMGEDAVSIRIVGSKHWWRSFAGRRDPTNRFYWVAYSVEQWDGFLPAFKTAYNSDEY